MSALPVRDPGPLALDGMPTPPARMPLLRDRRPRKQWRYVGAYGEAMMLCAGRVSIGGIPQGFYAVWDRKKLRERTVFRAGGIEVQGPVRFPGAELSLELRGDAVETASPHGSSYIWTRKQPCVVRGEVDGQAVELHGLIDDSAGYHARITRWSWCAGSGRSTDGRELTWNLVAGVHDLPGASELSVWVDGAARTVEPVVFDGLDAIRFAGGEELRFSGEAERARHDRLLLLDSAYRQPFGTFTGRLPGGIELASAFGVMERHDVRW